MGKTRQAERYEQAAKLLPHRLRRLALECPESLREQAEEIRLRVGRAMTVLTAEGERVAAPDEREGVVTQDDLEQMVGELTEYSRYASLETLRRGYLTVRGGFRVGLCGTVVLRDGAPYNMRDFSSLALRIVRAHEGVAAALAPQLFAPDGQLCSTLILSPPGGGKTTLLRDLVRCLSTGDEAHAALRVCVVDERSEIAVSVQGTAQMELGTHADVLDGCPKAVGAMMALRAMNPQVIALDEITAQEDVAAACAAANCGVALLASIHARDVSELSQKPLWRALLDCRVFARAVVIERQGSERVYRVEALGCDGSAGD